jgi:hypothetical protein
MKKSFIAAIAILLAFAGCFKDNCISTYTIYYPVYKSLTQARADMKSLAAQPLHNTGKIYVYGNYLFINEPDKGIHVIDNSNPAAPVNISFVAIPGNVDIAIKGNYLYADSYSDLVVFDITNVKNIHTVQFINNVFRDRNMYYLVTASNPDSAMVVVDYIAKDTTVACNTYNRWMEYDFAGGLASSVTPSFFTSNKSTGTGGSTASFTIMNNFLYTVSVNSLSSFNIENGSAPQLQNTTRLGVDFAETIFPFKNNLFIGTTTGVLIYDVSNASSSVWMGTFGHMKSCDPVIADGNNAYVTLSTGTNCGGTINELDVLDITDLLNPVALQTYPMTNPHGLSKKDNWLFVCDGAEGLKIYDAANPHELRLKKHITGFDAYDVILQNNIAIVVTEDGLHQFDYSDMDDIHEISKIPVLKK